MGLFSRKVSKAVAEERAASFYRRVMVPEQTEIVGVAHYQDGLAASLKREHKRAQEATLTLVLRADPNNPKDPDAIAVFHRDHLVGHIAKTETGIFHPQMAPTYPEEIPVVEAEMVVRGGRRYLRVYSFVTPIASDVGEPGPMLTIGNIRGQNVDQHAVEQWIAGGAPVGVKSVLSVAQLALHPYSGLDVVIHLGGVAVAVAPKGKREAIAREVRAATKVDATLGAPVRVAFTESGVWTVTIQKPSIA